MIETDEYGYPVATQTGVRCGNHPPQETVRHASVEAVGRCFALRFAEQAEEDALRYAESAGYWEGAAEWAWEDARGLVELDQAYREACPDLFRCEGCQTPEGQRCPDSCPVLRVEEAQERYANAY